MAKIKVSALAKKKGRVVAVIYKIVGNTTNTDIIFFSEKAAVDYLRSLPDVNI